MKFQLQATATGSKARAAIFQTIHGEVRTPLFMPVGTRAAVRAQTLQTLIDSGSQVLLANTYHILMRPGPEAMRKLGGIHRLMNWKGSVLTDSGGYQIFSLHEHRAMKEEGAEFTSPFDGRRILLTPELSIEAQKAIGSDIMMALDQCVPSTCDRALAEEAMRLTRRWAERSLRARADSPQALFGIVQGACYKELRRESALQITELPFDGFAIGGLAVGESKAEREDITEWTTQFLPVDRPRYLMGVGTPIDLLEAVHRGIDMMDCILPTAFAQQGLAFTSRGQLDLRRGAYRLAEERLDPECACPSCETHSRAYLHHLIKWKEPLGWQLIGAHNLYFYHSLMTRMRAAILENRFEAFYGEQRKRLILRDPENPVTPPKTKKRKAAPLALGNYEVLQSPSGFASVRHISSGEIMHSVNDPEKEACELYVEQPRLRERLAEESAEESDKPLIIWDVGLGAATNAMAALRCYENLSREGAALRPLRIISFENDLDSLRLASWHRGWFAHLRHPAPETLLEKGEWESRGVKWILHEGDFLARMQDAELPDLIYYDPFSSKTDSGLWTVTAFSKLLTRVRDAAVEIYTYSASTQVRSALLCAGFFVAKGRRTGPKQETTIALTPLAARSGAFELLDSQWLARWERSTAKLPEHEPLVRAHPQFRNSRID